MRDARPARARVLYRWLLSAAPPELRRRHGRDMEALFLEMRAHARCRGRLAAAAVWVRAAVDIAGAWPVHLRRRAQQRRRVGLPVEERHIMIGSDIRYAFRSLTRQKFATALVVAMLGLGIAANVAVFSLVNGIFLRPFPFDDPERLVYINEKAPKWNLDNTGINFPDFDAWRKGQQLFDSLAVFAVQNLNAADDTGAERLAAVAASHELARVLRLEPVLGRMFTAEEDKPGAPRVAVIGQGLWRERFGADRGVLGKTIRLSGESYTIIGVLPEAADVYPGNARLWIPLRGDPNQAGQSYSFDGVGRLKPGVTVAQAEQDLLRVHQAVWDSRDKERIVSPYVIALREIAVRDFRAAASTLTAAVALLLLVACANVAAVMLARALSRRREMGIRVSVGASRRRLFRQLLVENVMLAVAGGAIGLVLGDWAIRVLIASLPDQAPPWARFGLDLRVMAFASGTSLATVLVFGWAPAIHAVRGDLRSAMHNAPSASMSSHGGRRTLRALIAIEFALATLLLVCGGLLWRAYDRVRHVDPGFTPQGVLTFTISLPTAGYPDRDARQAFWDRLEARMQQLPGVRSAGLVNCPPFGCHWGSFYVAEGVPRGADDASPVVLNRWATHAYFETLGVRLKSGRVFDAFDGRRGSGAERVVVINETFAKTFFPGVDDPVGRRIRSTSHTAPFNRVIGVVADVKHYGLERPMRPGVYWPLPQSAQGIDTMAVALKTEGDPGRVAAAARAAVAELDRELPLFAVRTMEEAMRRTLTIRAAYSWMLAVFALTALVLALGGTYGVSSYLVTQRVREIGIRVALGARRGDIVSGVLRASMMVAAVGIGVGVAASLGIARLLETLLFGVKPHDAAILAGAVGVLIAAAVVATVLPARRAARVDPMTSLRAE